MKSLKTQIEIQATPSEVWIHLTQFHSYELWNPFISDIKSKGFVEINDKIKVTLTPCMPRLNKRMVGNQIDEKQESLVGKDMTQVSKSSSFKVFITKLDYEERLRWERNSFFSGDYIHDFKLLPTKHLTTIFHNNIQMKGWLVNLGWDAYIKHWYRSGLELMNEALKLKIESNNLYIDDELFNERNS